MMRFDFETYLPEDVLTKVDRMSMAHSIESRVPLLDNDVIDFAATLPSDLKIHNGRRKHVLKEAVRSLLPAGILDRKKQGFGVPLGVWFRGGLTDVFSDVLASPRTRQRGYFEPAFVDRLVHEHLSGRRDHTLRLWQLMVFELWHRHYLDAPVSSAVQGSPRNKCPPAVLAVVPADSHLSRQLHTIWPGCAHGSSKHSRLSHGTGRFSSSCR